MENNRNNIQLLVVVGIILVIVIIFSGPLFVLGLGMMGGMHGTSMNMHHQGYSYDRGDDYNGDHDHMSMADNRLAFLEHRDDIAGAMRADGDYACCLGTPCTYCIEKTPGHGEGASCHCLDDIMNGEHPCGECIGEILEGHGNKLISMYFATAIAEEVGIQYLDTIKQIIAEKYDISIEEQI